MSRRSLRRMAEDPRYIPGIHDYCDRWCDRCALTSRCLVFARTSGEDEPRDLGDLARRIEEDFAEAAAMLQERADEEGVDLSAPPSIEQVSADEACKTVVAKHPVLEAAILYSHMASGWLSAYAREEEGNYKRPAPGRRNADRCGRGGPFLSANEAIAIVGWYLRQIHVKLYRAFSASSFERSGGDVDEALQSDANGSAKVALLGIERSLDAWFELLHTRRGMDAIVRILEHLDSLREGVELAFPDARRFLRPGFDTGDAPWPDGTAS